VEQYIRTTKTITRDLQPRAAVYIREPQIASGTSSRCYFRINTQKLRGSRVDMSDLLLANQDLGHWSKASETGYTLRICNTNALMVFERGKDQFILRISSEETSACLHLIVRQSENPFTVTEILNICKEPPVIPHWSRLSGIKSYIVVHSDVVRKALPSGKGVQISFHKTENRLRFEIEVSLLPSYTPITSRVFPLPMVKLRPGDSDAQLTEAKILLQESQIHTRIKKAYLSPSHTATPRAISPGRPVTNNRTSNLIDTSPPQPGRIPSSPPRRGFPYGSAPDIGWRDPYPESVPNAPALPPLPPMIQPVRDRDRDRNRKERRLSGTSSPGLQDWELYEARRQRPEVQPGRDPWEGGLREQNPGEDRDIPGVPALTTMKLQHFHESTF
jgi:hypothetical protein